MRNVIWGNGDKHNLNQPLISTKKKIKNNKKLIFTQI